MKPADKQERNVEFVPGSFADAPQVPVRLRESLTRALRGTIVDFQRSL